MHPTILRSLSDNDEDKVIQNDEYHCNAVLYRVNLEVH
jgi:hypothetical protein